jgi:hypothetical protein
VPDVRVAAALVERCEYALHFGRAVACDGQPWALHVVLVEVRRGIFDANLRQAGTPRLEAHESDVPLKIDGVFGAAARLYMLPGRTRVVASGRLRAIYIVGLLLAVANFAHASVLPVNKAREPALLSEMGTDGALGNVGGPIIVVDWGLAVD